LNILRLRDAQLDEADLESVLSFAEKLLLDPARLWLEMSLELRQRFQLVLFLKGIEFMPNGEVGTAVTCSVFEILQPKTEDKTKLAAQVISSWNQIVDFLKQIAALQAVTT
jgi:hypothetical protein